MQHFVGLKSPLVLVGLLIVPLLWRTSHSLLAQPPATINPSVVERTSQLIFSNYDTVFTIHPDGSGRRTLVKRQFVASPSLSADGRRFAYDFYQDDLNKAETHIAPVDELGHTIVVAKRTKDAKHLFPLISPDGQSVLTQRRLLDAKGQITYTDRLMLFQSNGGRRELGPDTMFAYSYRFSRDGRSVIFAKSRASGLFRLSVLGGQAGAAQHLPIPYEVWEFDIAPDGRHLVFTSAERGDLRGLYSCTTEGTELRRLPLPAAKYRSPAWSPDGKAIAFTYDRGATLPGIRIVDVEGRNKRILTRDEANAGPIWR
jgi:dipeptidyl aminopeptidase/acylaminoacyl peptidase